MELTRNGARVETQFFFDAKACLPQGNSRVVTGYLFHKLTKDSLIIFIAKCNKMKSKVFAFKVFRKLKIFQMVISYIKYLVCVLRILRCE